VRFLTIRFLRRRIYENDSGVKRKIFVGRAEIYRTAQGGEIYSGCRWTLWTCESSTRTTLSTVFVFALPLAATNGSGLLFNFKSINWCDQTSIQALGL
jgi:hypothetical protein